MGAETNATLLDMIERSAAGAGTVRFLADSPDRIPVGSLWEDAAKSARWQATNIGTGAVVGTILTNTYACAATLLGAWRAGNRVASLPLPARAMPIEDYIEQMQLLCKLVGAQALLLDPEHIGLVGDLVPLPRWRFEDT